jgi:hypothetical protein
VLAGTLAGGTGERTAPPAAAAPGTATLEAGALTLQGPAGWTARDAPKLPGLELRDAAALGRGDARIVAGMTDAAGPALLPAAFTAGLSAPPAAREAVEAGEAQAFRYADLRHEDVDGELTVLAAPTTAGIATIACLGGADDRARCETAAGTLALAGGARAFALGPSKRYAGELAAPVARLADKRAAAIRRMASATTPDGQARAARDAASAYATAAQALGKVEPNPPERAAQQGLERAVRRARKPYAAAADAARGGHRRAWARARTRAAAADRAVNRALARFEALGYRVR